MGSPSRTEWMVGSDDSSEFCSLRNGWVAPCHSKEGEALLEYQVEDKLCFSGQVVTGMLMGTPCGNVGRNDGRGAALWIHEGS